MSSAETDVLLRVCTLAGREGGQNGNIAMHGLESCGSMEEKKKRVQQIIYGFSQLPNTTTRSLNVGRIHFPSIPWEAVIRQKTTFVDVTNNSTETDISKLLNWLFVMLGNQERFAGNPEAENFAWPDESDNDLAMDLLRWISENRPIGNESTILKILQHPFFWSSQKRNSFLVESCQAIKEDTNQNSAVRNKMEENKLEIFPEEWKTLLELNENDMTRLKKKSMRLSKKVIQNLIDNRYCEYDVSSVYSLLKFFRNHRIHYWDYNIQVRYAFGGYNKEYWDFFSSRFPKLFFHVYKIMKEHSKVGFQELFFKPVSLQFQ